MGLEDRMKRLERRHPVTRQWDIWDIHTYDTTNEDSDSRTECPKCAAMSDEEYADYCAWCDAQGKDTITHVVIHRSLDDVSEV